LFRFAIAIGWFFYCQEIDAFRFDGARVTDQNNFMERLRQVIVDYETVAERLETGKDAVFRISRSGEKQDNSAQTAGHYLRLVSHYMQRLIANFA
jgi:hypothetical protein